MEKKIVGMISGIILPVLFFGYWMIFLCSGHQGCILYCSVEAIIAIVVLGLIGYFIGKRFDKKP